MTREQVKDLLVEALRDFMGKDAPEEITEDSDSLKDLGLDSPDGVDLACELSERFDCHVPDNVNPLIDDRRNRARTVGEMIDLMYSFLGDSKS